MPPSIQVSFQGGGARFVEMLPIAHALADAHRNNHIKIARVAGCSAGSICAALIACDADFGKARKFIAENGPQCAKEMRRFSTNFGKKFCSISIDRIRLGRALMQARKGTSLLKTEVLMKFLNELFREALALLPDREIPPMEDLNKKPNGIRLAITGSDLTRSQGETFEQGNVLDRIASSCGIPFAFRTFTDVKTSPYVDGGVCENLPVERLLRDEDEDGAVFAVSIIEENPKPYIPANVKAYLLQLLSASMNHNVERAKRLVGLSNVIEARTELTTFDFEGAIAKLKDKSFYDAAYGSTLSRMIYYSQLHQDIQSSEPFSLSGRVSAPKVMRSLFKVFESTFATREWTYLKGTFLVRADGLKKTEIKLADRVSRITRIRAKSPNLVCFLSSAPLDAEELLRPTTWTCYNETKKTDLRIQAVPVQGSKVAASPSAACQVLLFLENPTQAIDKDDEITITSYYMVQNAMEGLVERGTTT